MDVKDFYRVVNGDYDAALERFGSEALMVRFVRKFPLDETMNRLRLAIVDNNIQESFSQAHTLKGVAGNLSFTELFRKASDLTEQLRPLRETADPALYEAVENCYQKVCDAIEKLEQ